jgi:electron transfer flavoprotein alpha subunit
MSDRSGVLFLAERKGRGLANMTAELATAAAALAAQLGEEVFALLAGTGLESDAQQLAGLGVKKVYVADDALYSRYQAEPYAGLLTRLVQEVKPRVILLGHTELGRDLAPRLAAKLDVAWAPNCVALEADAASGALKITRPVFGGKANGLFTLTGAEPYIATIGQKVFEPATAAGASGDVVPFSAALDPAGFRAALVEHVEDSAEGMRLEDAPVIVAGGRGIGGADGFKLLNELAEVLGGAVGASRAPVDSGWVPSNLQVGLTGAVVSPNVYLAIGISGAAQHMAGCSSSKTIIAINRDPEAPIFQRVPYGVVGDWREIVPELIEKCRGLRA